MTVTVVRHRNPNGDADSVADSYAKAVKDAIGSVDTADIQISSAWDAATGSIVTTILDFS